MQSKSIAFVVSYLLGAKTDFLRDNFKLDWEKSCECARFKNYTDVDTLRNLCIIRESVLSSYEKYTKKEFPSYVESSIEFLKGRNINIRKGLNALSVSNFFNYLSDMIDVIIYKCLVDLDLPKSDIIETLFNFPILSEEGLKNVVQNYDEVKSSNGLFVFCCERIKVTFSRMFLNDRNLFYSIQSIKNEIFSGEIPKYLVEYREEEGVDIDENIYINSDSILESYFRRNDIVVNGRFVGTKIDRNNLSLKVQKEIDRIMEMPAYLTVKNLKLFVDCDNIEFFKFLGFLNTLNPENINGIVLVIDEKSNYLWRVFDKIYKGGIPVKSIYVPRLKEQKSVVDVVLTKEVCQSVYCEGVDKVLLISSDSDFFGLISSLIEVDFGVCFVSNAMGTDYLKYLEENNIPSMDLLTVEDDCSIDEVKEIGFSYLLLYELSNVPMAYWTVSSLSDLLYSSFTNETDISVTKQEIKKFIGSNFSKVYVDIRDNDTYVCLRDFEIKVS